MKKKLYVVCYVIMILFIAWVLMSFIDINAHNKFGDYNYGIWNFFTLVFDKYRAW